MSTLKISEAGTVQFPMVKHAVEIGWASITPEDARTKRGGEAGTFFRDVLEAKLAAFNSWMSADAVRSVMETLDALPATIDGNRELLAWLRGERQWYDEAEQRHRAVTLIDFEHVANFYLWMIGQIYKTINFGRISIASCYDLFILYFIN